jgi:hypothetical protein
MAYIGDRVEHRINGFKGIATGRTEYLNGCRQFLVQPEKLDKEGKPVEGQWIDEQHLTVVTSQVFSDPFSTGTTATAGGPDRAERATS